MSWDGQRMYQESQAVIRRVLDESTAVVPSIPCCGPAGTHQTVIPPRQVLRLARQPTFIGNSSARLPWATPSTAVPVSQPIEPLTFRTIRADGEHRAEGVEGALPCERAGSVMSARMPDPVLELAATCCTTINFFRTRKRPTGNSIHAACRGRVAKSLVLRPL